MIVRVVVGGGVISYMTLFVSGGGLYEKRASFCLIPSFGAMLHQDPSRNLLFTCF